MKKVAALFTLLIIIITGIASEDLDAIMLKAFHKHDEMLGVSFEDLDGVEKGNKREIFKISDISLYYQKYTKDKLDCIVNYFKGNAEEYYSFFKLVLGDKPLMAGKPYVLLDKEDFPKEVQEYERISNELRNSFFDFPECVRIMWSYEREQIFVIGKEISENEFASTAEWPDYELVYWNRLYFNADYSPSKDTDYLENGVMRAPFWFYETNLKIRIVYQLHDAEGIYLGEFAADFYKFSDYDKLFLNSINK